MKKYFADLVDSHSWSTVKIDQYLSLPDSKKAGFYNFNVLFEHEVMKKYTRE